MNHLTRICLALYSGVCIAQTSHLGQTAEVVEVKAIWSRAPHNAFTDLIRYKNRWYCVFREGKAHASPEGAIRVLTSFDGEVWTPAALLKSDKADLRDPKLSITPDHRLLLNAAAAYPEPAEIHHRSIVWLSRDGRDWDGPYAIGDPNMWLWRITWHMGRAYSMAYRKQPSRLIRLYTSINGTRFEPLGQELDAGGPSEGTLLFLSDNRALCLLRREGETRTAQLGIAMPPYRGWAWRDLGMRIGGPNMIQLPDDRILAAGRLYDDSQRTALCWLDVEKGKLTEFLKLPSGGDTSYPGLLFYDGLLWVSYYSSHQGKAMIYIAKIKLPPAKKESRSPFVTSSYR